MRQRQGKKRLAVGHRDGLRPGMLRLTIAFPADQFSAVRVVAIKNGTTFGEAIRLLVETGLEEHGIQYE